MPRYFSKQRSREYFSSPHYLESKEHESEAKFELFCKKLKDRVLGRNKDGK